MQTSHSNPLENEQCFQKIIADIGGTNARFALFNSDGSIQDQKILKGADHNNFVSAFKEYLLLIGNPKVKEAAIAIANPIEGDLIQMTNHDWSFSIKAAKHALDLDSLIFKNDFEALAMSIPFLSAGDLLQVGGSELKKKKPIGVLGPGTGLGVSGLVFSGDKWIPLSSEGGHVSLSPTTPREIEIFEACLLRYDHVSAERLVSGKGLELLYSIVCELEGVKPISTISAANITELGLSRKNQQCIEVIDVFTGLLGVVAGNLALSLGAKGGIYIGGGIIPKLGEYFQNSPFRQRFEAKGRFTDYMKEIPVFVINAEYPALTGIGQVFTN